MLKTVLILLIAPARDRCRNMEEFILEQFREMRQRFDKVDSAMEEIQTDIDCLKYRLEIQN